MKHAAAVLWCLALPSAVAVGGQIEETSAETATAKHVVVEGQAYNHIGAGVKDAAVIVTLKESGKQIGRATTNRYGDFGIESTEKHSGTAVVTFSKKYFKKVAVEVELEGPQGPPFVDVEMTGAIVLAGTIIDDLRRVPVAGATVRAETGYKKWTATSKEDGSFIIEGLLPGAALLIAEADGYARLRQRIERTEEADLHVLLLKPERVVHLQIVDEVGSPVAGVSVECVDVLTNDYRHLVSDEKGRATVRGLDCETFEIALRLTHEAYVSSAEFDRTIELPQGETESSHRLVMHPAGTITGSVTSTETGRPVLGARLSVGEFLSDLSPRAWSEFDGTYRITGVPPGEAIITVHLSGCAPQLEKVLVEARKETTRHFAMAKPRSVTGTVVDPQDKPIAGVYVTATKWRDHMTLGLRAMTDAQGRFEILDAPLDPFEVSLYVAGYQPLLDQTIAAAQSTYAFTLESDTRAGATGGPTGPGAGDEAPPFTVKTLDGETIELAGLKGKVVLLDFWATWCGPCLGEIPNLIKVHQSFARRSDFVMLSISLDQDEAKLRSFVSARKMSWKHVCGATGSADRTADAYHVVAIPALFIIGPNGKIAASNLQGPQLKAELQRVFDSNK